MRFMSAKQELNKEGMCDARLRVGAQFVIPPRDSRRFTFNMSAASGLRGVALE